MWEASTLLVPLERDNLTAVIVGYRTMDKAQNSLSQNIQCEKNFKTKAVYHMEVCFTSRLLLSHVIKYFVKIYEVLFNLNLQ
jgi:hypothetical protein